MTERIERLVKRLREQKANTVEFFGQLRPADWDRELYTEGACWRIQEVLMHFLSSEKGIRRLVEGVVLGESGVPEGFDLDGFNERRVAELEGTAPSVLLDRFAQARSATIAMVEGFSDADLDKVGRHPFLGLAPVEDMIRLMYRHNQIHQREIRRVLEP